MIFIVGILATVGLDAYKQTIDAGPTDAPVDINSIEQISIDGVLHNCDAYDCTPVNE